MCVCECGRVQRWDQRKIQVTERKETSKRCEACTALFDYYHWHDNHVCWDWANMRNVCMRRKRKMCKNRISIRCFLSFIPLLFPSRLYCNCLLLLTLLAYSTWKSLGFLSFAVNFSFSFSYQLPICQYLWSVLRLLFYSRNNVWVFVWLFTRHRYGFGKSEWKNDDK